MAQINQSVNIVIRPSGVWDTRAPFFQFIQYHQRENQIYYALILCIRKLICETQELKPDGEATAFFDLKNIGRMGTMAWRSYNKSFPNNKDNNRAIPTMNHICHSLSCSIPSITEYAIISYCGLFETYIQCWALNYLLAKLESSEDWTSKERRLAYHLSPVTSKHLPSFVHICEAIPIIRDTLTRESHISVTPDTGEPINVAVTSNLNCYQTISFWRDWRNLLVHGSGMINYRFFHAHKDFWREFKTIYPYFTDFEVGKRLSLNDQTFRALTITHYRAAKILKDILVKASSERRGHILAPGPASCSGNVYPSEIPDNVPPLLLNGDHDASFKWISDASFRSYMRPILLSS